MNPYVVTIIGGFILLLIANAFGKWGIWESVLGFIGTIVSLTLAAITYVYDYLSSSMSINRLLFFSLIAILLLVSWRKLRRTLANSDNSNLEFLQYTKEDLKGITWKWQWVHNASTKRFSIADLLPYCPKCILQLRPVQGIGTTTLKCENCNKRIYRDTIYYDMLVDWVKREIRRRIEINSSNKDETAD